MNGILFYSTFLLILKGLFRPALLLSPPLFTITRSFLSLISTHSLSYMPHPPKLYPSFTSVMSSAPFAANDNMRLPAYRTSHLARFHPYSRAHPSLHQDYRFPEPPRGPDRGLASFAVREPIVVLVFVFFMTERIGLARDIPRRQWQSRKQVTSIHRLNRNHPQTTET